MKRLRSFAALALVAACTPGVDPAAGGQSGSGGTAGSGGDATSSPTASTVGGSSGHLDGGGQGGQPEGGGGVGEGGTPVPGLCSASAESLDYVEPCVASAVTLEEYDLVEKWSFGREDQNGHVVRVPPIVANLTDDNEDGFIDVCDIPDVVIVTQVQGDPSKGVLQVLSGADGSLVGSYGAFVQATVTPAIGDVDHDYRPEIVAADPGGMLVVMSAQLDVERYSEPGLFGSTAFPPWHGSTCTSVALTDLDADGDVEMVSGFSVYNADGSLRFRLPDDAVALPSPFRCVHPLAVDLNDDGTLEVLFGNTAMSATGDLLWSAQNLPAIPHPVASPAGGPEVFLTTSGGVALVSPGGTVAIARGEPFDVQAAAPCWDRPAAILDADGDGLAELVTMSCGTLGSLRPNGTVFDVDWQYSVGAEAPGWAMPAGLVHGDGTPAELAVAISGSLEIVDAVTGIGGTESGAFNTGAFVIVADVDNDGSADLLVTGEDDDEGSAARPLLTVIEDSAHRPLPARRIWNQHAYMPHAVREDATVQSAPGTGALRAQRMRSCE